MKDLGPDAGDLLVRLELASFARSLPERARLASRQLHRRLSSPIRVGILGHPKSGKTELLNLVAGERILEADNRLPSVELSYGETRRAVAMDYDGAEREIGFDDLRAADRANDSLLRIEAPLRVLAQVTLTEVVSDGTAEDERAAVAWAAERSDLFLWCSQEFSKAEQWLWSSVPERLKDHGFLVLTKADELIRDGLLQDRILELEDIVAEQFHSLIPVATRQGVTSQNRPEGRDEAAFRASGAQSLIDSLADHIEQGQRADMDAAMVLLSRFASQLADPAQAAEDDAPPPRPASIQPVLAPDARPTRATPSRPLVQIAGDPEAAREPSVSRPDGRATQAAPAAVPAQPADAIDTARADALDLLDREAARLKARLGGAAGAEAVLSGCADIASRVADALSEAPTTDPDGQRVCDTALEVSEMVVLMQLEETQSAAADAATLLLQLARDLERTEAA